MKTRERKVTLLGVAAGFILAVAFVSAASVSLAGEKGAVSGAELWSQNCGRCHNYRGPQEFNDFQWEAIVNHMRVIAGLPANQARAILRFLQSANNPPSEGLAAGDATSSRAGDSEEGRSKYSAYCASCHGPEGKGDGPAAASLSPKPRNLADPDYMGKLSDEYLEKVIMQGGAAVGKSPMMPAWSGTLSEADVRNIVSFLRELSAGR